MAASVRVLLATVIVALLAGLVTANRNHAHSRLRRQGVRHHAIAQQGFCANACQSRGYTDGCCDLTQNSCYHSFCGCYCDISCHVYHDCCPDIDNIECPEPSDEDICPSIELENGAITYDPTPNSLEVGTIAQLNCNDGFALVGSGSIRVCQSNLEWSNPDSVCRETCESLSDVNGVITYEPATNTPVARTVATYTCNEGYRLNGNAKRVCQGSSVWTYNQPLCVVFSCKIAVPDGSACSNTPGPINNDADFENTRCSCHVSCFDKNNLQCCDEIGCLPNSCAQAGVSPGCCDWNMPHRYKGACFIQNGRNNGTKDCYCDDGCKEFEDCCDDVELDASCPDSQSFSRGQSVRVRAQLAGGSRPRPSVVDQASKNLASELKSMTRAQVDKKYRWKVIAKELENMQQKKTY